mgnify:CR=1 FL=1
MITKVRPIVSSSPDGSTRPDWTVGIDNDLPPLYTGAYLTNPLQSAAHPNKLESSMDKPIPHYRRNFEAGHGEETAQGILTTVFIAGLQRLANRGEFETFEELYKEVDFLHELAARIND